MLRACSRTTRRKNVHRIYLYIFFSFFFLLRSTVVKILHTISPLCDESLYCADSTKRGGLKIPRACRFESIWQIGRFVRFLFRQGFHPGPSPFPRRLTTKSLALVVENSLYAVVSRTAAFVHAEADRACTRARFICFLAGTERYRRITLLCVDRYASATKDWAIGNSTPPEYKFMPSKNDDWKNRGTTILK